MHKENNGEAENRPSTPKLRDTFPDEVEERERLRAFLKDFARELNDQAPLASTITTVQRLFHRANVPKERWSEFLYQARSITQERSAQIALDTEPEGAGWAKKTRCHISWLCSKA